MLHLYYGSDEYSVTQAGAVLVRELLGDDTSSASRYDAAGISWPELRETCCTMSMFSPAQVIVVRGLLGLWSGRGDGGEGKSSANKPKPVDFTGFVAQMPESTHLVLLEGSLTATNRYLKELNSGSAGAIEVRALNGVDAGGAPRWIAATVRERGGTIEPPAAEELAARCGSDLRLLSSEIDKLLVYAAPEQKIRRADVDALVPSVDRANSFNLVDAVCTRQAPLAIDLAHRLLDLGEAPEAILALVGTRIRDLTMLDCARQERIPDEAVIKHLGWTPGRLYHLQKARGEFTTAQLREAQAALVAADAALKSRPAHERPTILVLTVLAIATRRGIPELEVALA